ncbi:MAG: glycosyltransferase family 39 protein [Candidatus Omnitrophica bacterium]|nr:glycosyltransferase family 39 protein [Candidatus Omnitrophota bacterium]
MFRRLKDSLRNINPFLVIGSVIFLGALLRLFRLSHSNLWFDEAYAVVLISREVFKFTDLFLLFYTLLHQWILLFGSSEFSLRLLPALFGIGSIPLIYLIGCRLFDKRVGLVSAAILAFSPFQLWYSQEVQPYSASVFFALLVSYFFLRAVESEKAADWWFFAVFFIAGFYIDEFLLLLVPFQAVYLLLRRRHLTKFFCFTVLSLALLSCFKIPTVIRFIDLAKTRGFWVPVPKTFAPLITLENFGFGYNLPNYIYPVSDLFVIVVLISAFFGAKSKPLPRSGLVSCLTGLLVPIAAVFLLSRFYVSIYTDRRFISFSPFYYLILAFGIVSFKPGWIKRFCCLAMFLLASWGNINYFNGFIPVPAMHHIGVQPKKPFKPAVKFIGDNLLAGDIIAHSNSGTMAPFIFYLGGSRAPQYFFTSLLNKDRFAGDYASESGGTVIVEKMPPEFVSGRVWLVCANWERTAELDENAEAVKSWMDRNFKQDMARHSDGIWVFCYLPKE